MPKYRYEFDPAKLHKAISEALGIAYDDIAVEYPPLTITLKRKLTATEKSKLDKLSKHIDMAFMVEIVEE